MQLIESNKSLKPFNTFGVEANARFFNTIYTVKDLQTLMQTAIYQDHHKLIIGGGSNILLTQDVDGLVLHNQIKGIEIQRENDEHIWVQFGAGEVWHNCVLRAIENSWAGVENLSLIPGYMGAAPMQNIGAYGVEIKDVFDSLEAVHLQSGEIVQFNNNDCNFGYRESIFKNKLKDLFFISCITLRLNKKPKYNISYGAIEQTLEVQGIQELSIKAISDAVIHIRQNKLPNPAKVGNAGSFFKNPVVKNSIANALKKEYVNMPAYPNGDQTKIPAAWLIDQCGWKGKVSGETGTYKNHALVLINRGNANGQEIFKFSKAIQQSVKAKFGIELKREVNVV